jgi:hypothetical protein
MDKAILAMDSASQLLKHPLISCFYLSKAIFTIYTGWAILFTFSSRDI